MITVSLRMQTDKHNQAQFSKTSPERYVQDKKTQVEITGLKNSILTPDTDHLQTTSSEALSSTSSASTTSTEETREGMAEE